MVPEDMMGTDRNPIDHHYLYRTLLTELQKMLGRGLLGDVRRAGYDIPHQLWRAPAQRRGSRSMGAFDRAGHSRFRVVSCSDFRVA